MRPSSHGKINWGRGRLRPFESVACFTAKFCTLNKISPTEFRKFMGTYLGDDFPRDRAHTIDETKMLVTLLNEPYEVVRTINPHLLDWRNSTVFGGIHRKSNDECEVRICQLCINEGLHTAFAEIPWIKLCPVHGVEHSTIGRYSRVGGAAFDRYVEAITAILIQSDPKWPLPPSAISRRFLFDHDSPTLAILMQWLTTANSLIRRLESRELWVSRPIDGGMVDDEVGIRRLLALQTPHVLIGPVLKHGDARGKCHILVFGEQVAKQWAEVTARLSSNELIYYYKRISAILDFHAPFRNVLAECSQSLQTRHSKCNCCWGWSKYNGWQKVDPDAWPHWGYVCPVTIAVTELISEWGKFPTVMAEKDTMREYEKISQTEKRCEASGVVQIRHAEIRSPIASSVPPFVLNIPPEVVHLLNVVLSAEIKARTEHLRRWLQAVSDGVAPTNRANTTGDVALFNWGNRLRMVTWHS